MFFPTQKYALSVKNKNQVTIASIAVIENLDDTIDLEVSDKRARRFMEITRQKDDKTHSRLHLEFRHALPATLRNEKTMKQLCNGILNEGMSELRLPEGQKLAFSYKDHDKTYTPLIAMLRMNTVDCAWHKNKKPRFLKRGSYTPEYN